MHLSKKQHKENRIIDAAEAIFGNFGFKNAKMDDIAREAGITKVTLYAYFQSKENLYMAVTYRAFRLLIDSYYQTIDAHKQRPGLDSVVAILDNFMAFCERHFLYSEAILDYFALVRSSSFGADTSKLTDGIQESMYFMKMQDVQNLPFKLSAKEIQRGQADGSIVNRTDPMFLSLHAWTQIVGYAKIINASSADTVLFNVDLKDLKKYTLAVARSVLQRDIVFAPEYQIDLAANSLTDPS